MENSLGCIGKDNALRQFCIKLATPNNWFDMFILFCIVANSLVMAMTDYSNVEGMMGKTGDNRYEPSTDGSGRNKFVEMCEYPFNIIFIIECVVKVIGLGFWGKKGSSGYIRDPWNKLDFVVVLISILGMLPGLPNLSVLRTFRVLRPLRTLAKSPGLRKIIGAVIDSIPDLANVIILLTFVLLIFAIAGLVFWNGILHARCRITPFPVRMPTNCTSVEDDCWGTWLGGVTTYYDQHWDYEKEEYANPEIVNKDSDLYRCLPESPAMDPNDPPKWTKDSSPWSTPQDCIWPVDEDDSRPCTLTGSGMHGCRNPDYHATCGSDYDEVGNARFIESMVPYGSVDRSLYTVWHEDMQFGYTSYDNIFKAFVTTFQSCSMEGWTTVMYHTMDAWAIVPSVLIFVILVLIGGNIVLNLVLAVVTSSLDKLDEEDEEEEEEEEEEDGIVPMDEDGGNEDGLDSDDDNFMEKLKEKMDVEGGSDEESEGDSDSESEEEESGSEEESDSEEESEEEEDAGFNFGSKGDDDDEDSDSDDDDEGKVKRKASKKDREAEVSRREELLASGEADANPQSTEDFERILAGSPNDSSIWIRYMAFHVYSADYDAARAVADRAAERIDYTKEEEKTNVYMARIAMELEYGSEGNFLTATQNACRGGVNGKKIMMRTAEVMEKALGGIKGKKERAKMVGRIESHFENMCKKNKSKKKVWLAWCAWLVREGRWKEGRDILKRSLLSLGSYKHVEATSRFAQIEFEFGSPERARTIFEGLMDKYPKKLDLWFVYIDKEVKHGSLEAARRIFEKLTGSNGVKGVGIKKDKRMKAVFKKWFQIEKRLGDEESMGLVQKYATEFVEKTQ